MTSSKGGAWGVVGMVAMFLSKEKGLEAVHIPTLLEGQLTYVAQRQAEIVVGTIQAVEGRPVEALLHDTGIHICTMITSEAALTIFLSRHGIDPHVQ